MDQGDTARTDYLVVIGSSAGGIEALGAVLGTIPADFSASIVIAQHLQPTRDSRLAEILGPRSRIPVRTVEGREPLERGTAYLVPPDRHVSITDHEVSIQPALRDHPAPSLNRLLRSAADTFGDRVIAVILSGMGSDGAAGAADVKTHGGTVIIQNPETASHPGMPRALPPNIVDFVPDADRIGDLLAELVSGSLDRAGPDEARMLAQFLDQVRERTGIDFSAYKSPTVRRRLQRRMVATSSPKLRDYIRYVQKHPEEYSRLTSAFLIKVTQFFRDADLFDYLRDTILPRLIEDSRRGERDLRLWSGGCATGEEAYSLAMLVADALGAEMESFTIRIFATDLDRDAIAFARRGVYPASSVANVPPNILSRYFTKIGVDFEVNQPIRSMVVFGQHDLGQRAPFPRIDLALCRNVLIYFTPDLQKRALQLFAFSLREGGLLVLGKAESTTPFAEHFILEHPRLKVYRRAGERVLIPPARIRDAVPVVPGRPPQRRTPQWPAVVSRSSREGDRSNGERPDQILMGLPVGVVVVDTEYDIVSLNAAARRLIGIHEAAVDHDFVHLAKALPSEDLRQGLDAALRGETTRITLPIDDPANDREPVVVDLHFQPKRRAEGGPVGSVIITVVDASTAQRERRELMVDVERDREDAIRVRDRVDRLERSNRDLLTANEEFTSANTMLRTANEELLLANEEVQAATEEVETLNEELQATNEELETLNEELQATVEELNTTNDELESRSMELQEAVASLQEQRVRSETERARLALIFDGMSEAVLAVDREGRPVATNHAYEQLFGERDRPWTPEDEAGNPLPSSDWPQERAAQGEAFSVSFTVQALDGTRHWLEATSSGGNIGEWGGVIVFRDLTDRSLRDLQSRFMAVASHELQTPVAALHGFLQIAARRLAEGDTAATGKYVERSISETRRLSELVSRLLDVSLIQHGRVALNPERIDLVSTVKDALTVADVLNPHVRFSIKSAPRSLRLIADPLRIQQVVINLVLNAATHGSVEGGEVGLEITRQAGKAVLEVGDRGPGIPDDVTRRMFVPFVGTGSDHQGLGLGLFLAHEIVTAHGGSIDVAPREGGGTQVRVRLPTDDGNPRSP